MVRPARLEARQIAADRLDELILLRLLRDSQRVLRNPHRIRKRTDFGVGRGNSMQKQFLPEPHTDFVFAFAGEELGLFGTLSVIALFMALGVHGYRIATQATTYHGFLLASGITVMIGVYALLNVGVVTGMVPTTGLPLPFISYGGSSLLWNLSGVGILAAVARDRSAEPSRSRSLARDLAWRRSGRSAVPGWMPPTAPATNR